MPESLAAKPTTTLISEMYLKAFTILSRSRDNVLKISDIIAYGQMAGYEDLETFIVMMQAADEVFLDHHGYGS